MACDSNESDVWKAGAIGHRRLGFQMKAVLQRVTSASVEAEGKIVGQIRSGLLVLLGVAKGDSESDGRYLVEKIRTLRVFPTSTGK